MKKMNFRWFAFLLALVMAGSILTGCSSKKGTGAVMDKDHVYKAEYISLPEGIVNVNRLKAGGGKIYLDGYDANSMHQYKIFSMNEDGSDFKSLLDQYVIEEGAYINNYTTDSEGNLYLLENKYIHDEINPENSKSVNYFKKLDTTGKVAFTAELPSDIYVMELLVDGKGNLIGLTNEALLLFDGQGKQIGEIDTTGSYVQTAFVLDDGRLITSVYNQDYTKREMKEVLVDQKKLGEAIEIPGTNWQYSFFPGSGYDIFLKDSTDIYGYNFDTKEQVQLLNFIDSDINGSMIYNVCALSNGKIACVTNDYMKGSSELAIMSKVAPEDVVEKKVLSLAAVYVDYQLGNAVIEFNKKNEKYRITIKDYSVYNTDEDYMAGTNKLNTDIISGDVPDILCVNDSSSFNSATSKGLFLDLYKLMDKDESFQKTDYLENIIKAFEKDGKLFTLVPYFNTNTIVGKTSNVGKDPGWTMDEFEALMASKPDAKAFRDMTRENIMYYGSYLNVEQFIDYKKGTCNFDDPEFIRLLQFANEYPSQEELYGSKERVYQTSASTATNIAREWEYDENAFRSDKILLNIMYLSSFNEIHQAQMVDFGEEVTFIGFPCASKNGSAISPGLQLAIAAKSSHQDAAWDFLKILLGDDFQNGISYGWPIKLSSIETKKEKEQKPDTYIDEKGNEVEYENTYYINGKEVKVGKATDEECEKVMNYLRSLSQIMWYDQTVNEIITEESGAFFAGQKNVEETTKIIQNRVQTYLNEIQ